MNIYGAAGFALNQHQGMAPHATIANGGGGSGGGTDTRYANLDALYGTQNQASQFMLDNAMPYIPGLTQNSAGMVNEAMSGQLGERARNLAGTDANQALGDGLAAANRNLSRYGAEMNAGRMQKSVQDAAMGGALNKATAMNKASQWAEDQKWNRNANFYGQVMGMNNGAMQGMNSAGAGLSNVANQQNANDRANAAGYGQAGASFGAALFKADGGYIEGEAARLAGGGDAWLAYKQANPVRGNGARAGRTNGVAAFLGGAAPGIAGAGLKDILNLDGKGGKIVKASRDLWDKGQKTYDAWQTAQDYNQAADTINAAVEGQQAMDGVIGMADVGALGATYDAAGNIVAAADGASAAASTAQTASELSTAADINSAGLGGFADGGRVSEPPKRGLRFALGGAMPKMKNMSVADNGGVASMDASASMNLARLGDAKKANNAKVAPGYHGKTDGMGESSDGDPDGFGVYNADSRNAAGSATIKYIGNGIFPGLGTLLGDTVAGAIHPVMQEATRNAIVTGDQLGGVSGAVMMDPVGAAFSGKYKPEELVKGSVAVGMGLPWAGKFLADGGLSDAQREDFTPGGSVSGPGTGTSDSIPAWLSNGEHVQNEVSTKLTGKDTLDEINNAGLAVRQGKATATQAKQKIGRVMVERGLELADGKPGVKLAGGGFLGGNLGIAMGAGVDQYNRERQLANQDKSMALAENADARAAEMQPVQMEQARQRNELTGLAAAQGKRDAEVAEMEQSFKLDSLPSRYAAAKQELKNKLGAGKLSEMQVSKELLGSWADADDALGNQMLKDPEWQAATRIKDANYVKGSNGMVDITFDDGTQWRTSKEAIKKWRQGNEPLKMQVIGEGGLGVMTDRHGRVVNTIENRRAPDGSKNDAAMDDAAGVMNNLLDANKTMMTQFGGKETEIRQGAVLLHNQGIGEFKETYGRAPNRREAALIAEQALKVASQKASQK